MAVADRAPQFASPLWPSALHLWHANAMKNAPLASVLVSGGIAGLALLVAVSFVLGVVASGRFFGETRPQLRRDLLLSGLLAVVWLSLPAWLAYTGVLADFKRLPPPLILLIVPLLGASLALGLSRCGWRLAHGLPLATLVGVQGFRFPLEVVMHQAAIERVMPIQMSYSGHNFDIITGITAIVLSLMLARDAAPRWLVWAWNLVGMALLVNIVTIAVRSMPLLHAYGTKPQQLNTWIAFFPFVWLPTVLVAAAILGHVVVTRRLLDV